MGCKSWVGSFSAFSDPEDSLGLQQSQVVETFQLKPKALPQKDDMISFF